MKDEEKPELTEEERHAQLEFMCQKAYLDAIKNLYGLDNITIYGNMICWVLLLCSLIASSILFIRIITIIAR